MTPPSRGHIAVIDAPQATTSVLVKHTSVPARGQGLYNMPGKTLAPLLLTRASRAIATCHVLYLPDAVKRSGVRI